MVQLLQEQTGPWQGGERITRDSRMVAAVAGGRGDDREAGRRGRDESDDGGQAREGRRKAERTRTEFIARRNHVLGFSR